MRLSTVAVSLCALTFSPAWAHDESRLPRNASFTTLSVTPFAIEGLTGDAAGNLYTTGRQPDTAKSCPVWRIGADGSRTTVGFIANSTGCNPSGITFDRGGDLYIADAATISGVSGFVWKVTPHPIGCQSDDSASAICAAVPIGERVCVRGAGNERPGIRSRRQSLDGRRNDGTGARLEDRRCGRRVRARVQRMRRGVPHSADGEQRQCGKAGKYLAAASNTCRRPKSPASRRQR